MMMISSTFWAIHSHWFFVIFIIVNISFTKWHIRLTMPYTCINVTGFTMFCFFKSTIITIDVTTHKWKVRHVNHICLTDTTFFLFKSIFMIPWCKIRDDVTDKSKINHIKTRFSVIINVKSFFVLDRKISKLVVLILHRENRFNHIVCNVSGFRQCT